MDVFRKGGFSYIREIITLKKGSTHLVEGQPQQMMMATGTAREIYLGSFNTFLSPIQTTLVNQVGVCCEVRLTEKAKGRVEMAVWMDGHFTSLAI